MGQTYGTTFKAETADGEIQSRLLPAEVYTDNVPGEAAMHPDMAAVEGLFELRLGPVEHPAHDLGHQRAHGLEFARKRETA